MARKKIMFQKLQELISRYEFKIEDMKVTVAKAADVTVAKTFEFLPRNLYVMDQAYFEQASSKRSLRPARTHGRAASAACDQPGRMGEQQAVGLRPAKFPISN